MRSRRGGVLYEHAKSTTPLCGAVGARLRNATGYSLPIVSSPNLSGALSFDKLALGLANTTASIMHDWQNGPWWQIH
jgi:hypothetical protein